MFSLVHDLASPPPYSVPVGAECLLRYSLSLQLSLVGPLMHDLVAGQQT